MNGLTRTNCAVLFLVAFVISCGARDDIVARYRLEKLAWQARLVERRMTMDHMQSSERDIDQAIDAFEAVVAADPLPLTNIQSWNPAVVTDITTIVMGSRIALAHLYFQEEKYFQAGIYFRSGIDDPVLVAAGSGDRKHALARSLYGIPSGSGNEIRCERYFREIVSDDDFWIAPLAIKESFLEIPLVLARIHKDRKDQHAFEDISGSAESFYSKVIGVWPDSLIADQARFKRVQLMLVREEWAKAVRLMDQMMAHPYGRTLVPRLLLLKGRVAEVGLRKRALALESFSSLMHDYPDAPEAHAGEIFRAMILAKSGEAVQAMQLLRAVEKNETASDDMRAAAMLVRATQMETDNKWNESIVILRRLQNQYPLTEAALEAPLIATRYYSTIGDSSLVIRNLERSKQLYLSLIERKNTLIERGLLPIDYLIENYLLAGKAEEIAKILAEDSYRWGWSGNAGALLKSAHLYANDIGDRQRSKEILKKCLAQFPETRYSDVARKSLTALGAE